MKILLKILLLLAILGMAGYLYLAMQWGPYGRGGTVYIPRGSSLSQIATLLEQGQLVRSAWSFKLLARWKGQASQLKPGEYVFSEGPSAAQVLDKIVRGDRLIRRITIPEGYSFAQIAALIEQAGIAPRTEVMKSFRDPTLLGGLGFAAPSLEGYLFPATYEYDRQTKVPELLKEMVDNFKRNTANLAARATAAGWTFPQLVTLASLIEKETGQAKERPLISSVFQNRLRIGMPLQTDPSVIYGLANFDGNLRRDDLRNPHPYNTYVHIGLPPGPIASPGMASLEAVLAPATSNYLFFVSKGDGTHFFSSTLDEHNAAVARYQLGKGSSTETAPSTPAAPKPQPKPAAPSASQPADKAVPMPGAPLPQAPSANTPLMKTAPVQR
ncbi:MAG TPA: endolytic transglycosylase MltG [bacterium]|nr:endolytic transglycosylase MltG [bacterium]